MLRKLLPLGAICVLAAAPGTARAQADTLSYRFHLEPGPDHGVQVAVDVDFRGGRTGRTRIVTPTTWAGQDSLWKAIVDFRAGPGVVVGPDVNGERILQHLPRARVHLHYVLRQDWTGPLRYPLNHRVIIDSSRIVFNQTTALVYPELTANVPLVLQVQWSGLPPSWRILTSFGSKAWFSGPVSWREFAGASFAAGDFRLVGTTGGAAPLTIEAQGQWRFTDPAVAQLVGALWRAESRFWGGPAFDHAFVLLLPSATSGAVAGTAFTAGFVAASDSTADLTDLGRLLAHELFHLWNGQRMAATEVEARYKWFTEGFTDYYADRFFHQLGQYSDSTYRARVNAVLRSYYASPARGSTLADVAARYYADPAMRQYPYAQGYAFALFLQPNLTRWSGATFDLDSLMVRAYRAGRGHSLELTDALLLAVTPAAARGALHDAIDRYIVRGMMVPGDSASLGLCNLLRTVAVYDFDLGFDAATSTRQRVVNGVRPGGPAALAGVADGMKLLGWSWDGDRPAQPVVLQVQDARGPRQIVYAAHDNTVHLTPQFFADPSLACGGAGFGR